MSYSPAVHWSLLASFEPTLVPLIGRGVSVETGKRSATLDAGRTGTSAVADRRLAASGLDLCGRGRGRDRLPSVIRRAAVARLFGAGNRQHAHDRTQALL